MPPDLSTNQFLPPQYRCQFPDPSDSNPGQTWTEVATRGEMQTQPFHSCRAQLLYVEPSTVMLEPQSTYFISWSLLFSTTAGGMAETITCMSSSFTTEICMDRRRTLPIYTHVMHIAVCWRNARMQHQ